MPYLNMENDDAAKIIREKITAEISNGGAKSIIDLVNNIIELAHLLLASDIHIDPQENNVRVRLRIDGALQDETPLPKNIHPEIISRIKILSGLHTDQHQTAQDGRFKINTLNSFVDIRVSIIPTYYGENAMLRLLKNTNEICDLKTLGFSPANTAKILQAIKSPYGMILATGPTGSGKTTTLYTLIKLLNAKHTSIITIEDPIEYSVEGINQIGVNAHTGLTFANGLRSVLRQDPNIIMVGEIRDQETAGLAINAALTGHLVLSSIHTNSAAATLPRLIDLGIEPYLIASTVNIVIAQRLVRKICQNCKTPIALTDAQKQSLGEAVSKEVFSQEAIFYRGKGCQACNNTGYRRRISINEVLIIDDAIREAICKKTSAKEIQSLAKTQDMVSIIEDGFLKAQQGVTTIEEILRTFHE